MPLSGLVSLLRCGQRRRVGVSLAGVSVPYPGGYRRFSVGRAMSRVNVLVYNDEGFSAISVQQSIRTLKSLLADNYAIQEVIRCLDIVVLKHADKS